MFKSAPPSVTGFAKVGALAVVFGPPEPLPVVSIMRVPISLEPVIVTGPRVRLRKVVPPPVVLLPLVPTIVAPLLPVESVSVTPLPLVVLVVVAPPFVCAVAVFEVPPQATRAKAEAITAMVEMRTN
jgi:hypothetical protein